MARKSASSPLTPSPATDALRDGTVRAGFSWDSSAPHPGLAALARLIARDLAREVMEGVGVPTLPSPSKKNDDD